MVPISATVIGASSLCHLCWRTRLALHDAPFMGILKQAAFSIAFNIAERDVLKSFAAEVKTFLQRRSAMAT